MDQILRRKPDIKQVNLVYIDKFTKDQPFDAAYFRKSRTPENSNPDKFFMRFNEPERTIHNVDLGSDRWLVFLLEDEGAVYFKAYIGDPFYFTNNQVKARSDGVVIKESSAGYLMLLNITADFEPTININKQLKLDYVKYLFKAESK